MAEFVNLNQEDDSLNIVVYNPTSINNVKLDTPILDDDFINTGSSEVLYTIDSVSPPIPEEIEYEDCNSCDVSKFYGNTNSDDSFKRENLFSELVTEYQRAIARQNLGIADEYSLLWGNISGNSVYSKTLPHPKTRSGPFRTTNTSAMRIYRWRPMMVDPFPWNLSAMFTSWIRIR